MKRLFTPGPLTTSRRVKDAMLRDIGSREGAFIEVVAAIRRRLLDIARAPRGYEAIPVQGSGTYALEAALSSFVPSTGKLLALTNGSYGERLAKIAGVHGIPVQELSFAENLPVDPALVARALAADADITHVSVVHCETSTGMLNPLPEIAQVTRAAGRLLFVDAMSSFGGIPIEVAEHGIDCLISSSNKCIEGVPGFAFVIARKELLESGVPPRTVSLDLTAQWRGLEADGQFRFTPPTQVMLAFDEALTELEDEGGVAARYARYCDNHRRLIAGMSVLGFRTYLPDALQAPIITSFRYPTNGFRFDALYRDLESRGFVIYPGKTTKADTFRIGTIGHLFADDIDALLGAVAEVTRELGVGLL